MNPRSITVSKWNVLTTLFHALLHLAEAFFLLCQAWYVVRFSGFDRIRAILGDQKTDVTEDKNTCEKQRPEVKRVGAAVYRASRLVPFKATCYVKALTAARMLSRRGIPYNTTFGVGRDADGKFEAHVWVRSGQTTVTGWDVSRPYSPIGHFQHNGDIKTAEI